MVATKSYAISKYIHKLKALPLMQKHGKASSEFNVNHLLTLKISKPKLTQFKRALKRSIY